MKIVVSSDIHNDPALIDRLVYAIKKEDPDMLLLLGDIADWGDIPKGLFNKLIRYIDKDKIFVLPGNHETPDIVEFWYRIYGVNTLHSKFIIKDNKLIAGIGGGDMPMFMISEEEIKEFLKEIKKISEKYKLDILLFTHIHPRYSQSSKLGGGSIELYKFIKYYSPKLLVHGHIHEFGGLEEIIHKTKVINTARSIFVLEIDKDIKSKRIN